MNFLVATHAPTGFPHAESHVRAMLGWNKDEMRQARQTHLTDKDFTIFKKRIYLSTAAAAQLAAQLAAPSPGKNAAAAPSSIADVPQPLRTLIVCVTNLANPRLVLACPEDEKPERPVHLMRVRIQPGTQFRRRQVITVRPIPPYTDYFIHVPGRQAP